jgi:hypothetical protein
MRVWTVTVMSPQLVHITIVIFYWSTDPTISTPIFPHIKTIFYNTYENNILKINSVRLAQTMLDKNMTACGTMRANTVFPRHLEGEGKHLKKEKSAFSGGMVT